MATTGAGPPISYRREWVRALQTLPCFFFGWMPFHAAGNTPSVRMLHELSCRSRSTVGPIVAVVKCIQRTAACMTSHPEKWEPNHPSTGIPLRCAVDPESWLCHEGGEA